MAKYSSGISGVEKVMQNLNKEYAKLKGEKTAAGLARVAIIVRRAGEDDSPTTPLDTGNLRASFFAAIKGSEGLIFDGTGVGSKSNRRGAENTAFQTMVVDVARQAADASPFPVMFFGYSARYAAAVHEMVGDINWSKKGSGAKFFEHSLRSKKGEILKILADSIKL